MMREQCASVAPLMVMVLAAAVGKLYSTFWRVAAEVREVREYGTLGAYVVSDSAPVVVTFEQIISAEEAAHIISLARPRMQPGHVAEHPQWFALSGVVRKARTSGRTNSVAWLEHNATPVVRSVVDRISDVVGISSMHAEAVHVIQYTDGQEYKRHLDGYSDDSITHSAGQRLVTALVYLTTVADEAGGATQVGAYQIQPILGRVLVFHNCQGKTNVVDHRTAHAGLPVRGTAVQKWAFNLWYHEYEVPSTLQPQRTMDSDVQQDSTLDDESGRKLSDH